MILNPDDLPYFLAFVLLDETRRSASGKRQTAPLEGMWMSRQGATGMRLSDRRFRCAVCIEALRSVGGLSVDKAAAEVAALLGQRNAGQVNVIRVAYYECRRLHAPSWDALFYQFLHWRAWVFESDEETFQIVLQTYPLHLGSLAQRSLATWIARLRNDPQQMLRNRSWMLEPGEPARSRIESNYWNPENNWQQFATDLWTLGRLHAGIGESDEARILLGRALEVWQTRGHKLAEVQKEAIRMLEAEIAQFTTPTTP